MSCRLYSNHNRPLGAVSNACVDALRPGARSRTEGQRPNSVRSRDVWSATNHSPTWRLAPPPEGQRPGFISAWGEARGKRNPNHPRGLEARNISQIDATHVNGHPPSLATVIVPAQRYDPLRSSSVPASRLAPTRSPTLQNARACPRCRVRRALWCRRLAGGP